MICESIAPTREARERAFSAVDLYPVTSVEHSRGRSTEAIVQAIVQAGCRIVQLREKTLTKKEYYELAVRVRALTPGVLLVCNDHLDVALAVGADGVHLGADDLPVSVARALAPGLLIGASSHSLEEALALEAAGASYVNIGPIFATATKARVARFLGPDAIRSIAPRLGVPFTVMGGIGEANLDLVVAAGARRVAVVTAVTAAPDPALSARALRERISAYREGGEA